MEDFLKDAKLISMRLSNISCDLEESGMEKTASEIYQAALLIRILVNQIEFDAMQKETN